MPMLIQPKNNNFVKRLFNAIGLVSGSKSSSSWGDLNSHFGRLNNSQSASSTLKSSTDYLNAYQFISYVGKNVQRMAGDIASLPMEFRDQRNTIVDNLALRQLFNKPNSVMDDFAFRYMCISHLLLDGNCFIIPDTTNLGDMIKKIPSSIYIANPSDVTIYDGAGMLIEAGTQRTVKAVSRYDVRIYNIIYTFKPEEIIHIKLPSPTNAIRGMGIIQMNAPALDADRFQSLFNNAFFNGGAVSNLLIQSKETIGVKQWKLFMDEFREAYEGQKNWYKTIFMPSNAEAKEINLSHKDMEFIEQKKLSRDDIDSYFNIPPLISGSFSNVKYDTAREQLQVYYSLVLPRWVELLKKAYNQISLTQGITVDFPIKKVIYQDQQNSIAKDMFDRGVIDGNEYREMLDLSRIDNNEHLNTRFMLLNYITADQVSMPIVEQTPPKSLDSVDVKYEQNGRITPKQRAILVQSKRTKERIGKQIKKDMRKFFEELESSVIANIEKSIDGVSIKSADDPIHIDDVENILKTQSAEQAAKNVARRTFTSSLTIGIKDVNDIFDAGIEASSKNPQFNLVVEKLARNYQSRIIDTQRNELRKILTDAINEGESIHELKSRINDHFSDFTARDGWKLERIARTESSYAWDQAAKMGYDELGVKTVDIVGCEDDETDCNSKGVPIEDCENLVFHPNHTGSIVPSISKSNHANNHKPCHHDEKSKRLIENWNKRKALINE